MKLEGRTVLITGGTSGVGDEMARQLLARRNTVLVTGRDKRRLEETKASLPGVYTIQSDVSMPDEIEALRDRILREFPGCDTLINNAGIMRNLNLNDQRSPTDITQEIDICLTGPVQMVHQFLPHLKNRPHALIVNVSSGVAFVPFPLSPVYSAAKAGIHAFTRCLRVQLQNSNIKVVELAPPGVETRLFRAEFEKEMKGQKGHGCLRTGYEGTRRDRGGRTEIRPGLSNVLYLLSRFAPSLPFGQMAKMVQSRPVAVSSPEKSGGQQTSRDQNPR